MDNSPAFDEGDLVEIEESGEQAEVMFSFEAVGDWWYQLDVDVGGDAIYSENEIALA